MAQFEKPFTPKDLDQQLDQSLSGVPESKSQAQLLAELHHFHRAAASAEKRSIASAWQRIEYRQRLQQEEVSEKKPLSIYRTMDPPNIKPRIRQKRRLATLVAILVAFLLIGGITMALVQKQAIVGSPVPTATPHSTAPTPDRTGTAVYTEKEVDNGMVLAWSPDSQRLLSARTNLHIWDATTGQHLITYQPVTRSLPVQNAAWAPDKSQRVAIADGTGVKIVDAQTGKVLLTGPKDLALNKVTFHLLSALSAGTPAVRALAWSPDGNKIASSITTFDGSVALRTITIWDSHTGAIIKKLVGHTDDIYNLAWSPNGKYLASLAQSQDNTVRLWNVTTGEQIYKVHASGYGAMERLAWSPNGEYLAVQMQVQIGNNTLGMITTRDEIQVWKALTHQVITHYKGVPAGYNFTGFSWSPDSTRLVSTIDGLKAVRVWSALSGQNLSTYQGEMASLVAWSPDGKYIALAEQKPKNNATVFYVTSVWNAPAGA